MRKGTDFDYVGHFPHLSNLLKSKWITTFLALGQHLQSPSGHNEPLPIQEPTGQPSLPYLWSAKVSLFSAFRVPAVANMMVVSRSAMIPDTAVAAVIHAWVPLFPAWRADSTKDTYRQRGNVRGCGRRRKYNP